jgi:hypothetical protein
MIGLILCLLASKYKFSVLFDLIGTTRMQQLTKMVDNLLFLYYGP